MVNHACPHNTIVAYFSFKYIDFLLKNEKSVFLKKNIFLCRPDGHPQPKQFAIIWLNKSLYNTTHYHSYVIGI